MVTREEWERRAGKTGGGGYHEEDRDKKQEEAQWEAERQAKIAEQQKFHDSLYAKYRGGYEFGKARTGLEEQYQRVSSDIPYSFVSQQGPLIDQTMQAQPRQAQIDTLAQLQAGARGAGPSVAAQQAMMGQDVGTLQAMQAAGAGAGPAAMQQAQQAASAQAIGQAGATRLGEQAQAQQAAAGLAQQARGQDIGLATQEAQMQQQRSLADQQMMLETRNLQQQKMQQYLAMGMDLSLAEQRAKMDVDKIRLADATRQRDIQADLAAAGIRGAAAGDASTMGMVGTAVSSLGSMLGAYMMSDRTAKTDITDGTANIDEFVSALHSYGFKYNDERDGPGDRHGIMVQDIENTEIGRTLVRQLPGGKKGIDIAQGLGAALSGIARLNQKIEELKGRK